MPRLLPLLAAIAICLGVAVGVLSPRGETRRGLAVRSGLVFPASLVRLLDGDTAIVQSGGGSESIRFVGIDTPEISHEGKPAACYGLTASAVTQSLLGDGRLRITVAREARDRYGRVLAYLTPLTGPVAGQDLATAIATAGAARQLEIAPNIANAGAVSRAVATAKRQRLGLWHDCTPATAFPGKKL